MQIGNEENIKELPFHTYMEHERSTLKAAISHFICNTFFIKEQDWSNSSMHRFHAEQINSIGTLMPQEQWHYVYSLGVAVSLYTSYRDQIKRVWPILLSSRAKHCVNYYRCVSVTMWLSENVADVELSSSCSVLSHPLCHQLVVITFNKHIYISMQITKNKWADHAIVTMQISQDHLLKNN